MKLDPNKIAPEPPKHFEECVLHLPFHLENEKCTCGLKVRTKAHNLKHNHQIDWKEFKDKMPSHGDEFVVKGWENKTHTWSEYYDISLTDWEEWCYAKEYEEAKAIKKSIRPFGEAKIVNEDNTVIQFKLKNNFGLTYWKVAKQFVLAGNGITLEISESNDNIEEIIKFIIK